MAKKQAEPKKETLFEVRVGYPFTDSKTGKEYALGDTFEASEERISEINKVARELNLPLIQVL